MGIGNNSVRVRMNRGGIYDGMPAGIICTKSVITAPYAQASMDAADSKLIVDLTEKI